VSELEEATAILRFALGARVRTEVAIAPLTSFRLGGPAALFLEPDRDDDLRAVAEAVRATGLAVLVLGKGSNVLIADAGFPGLVLRLGRGYRWSARDGDELRGGGAMALPALAGVAAHHGLDGLAFGVAIPASLGGAVVMNAGAHGGEMAALVRRIDLVSWQTGEGSTVPAADAGFAYRTSRLPGHTVVTGATLGLRPGDPAAIRSAMDEARAWRRRTQPLAEPNCGSVFTNPDGDHAARLIDAAGLKGTRVGGAAVSAKHANFIVTRPGATAADVRALIALVQERVERETGVALLPEVRFVDGVDG
jgi:UDP-N-acetylmuramate dehydrogenase